MYSLGREEVAEKVKATTPEFVLHAVSEDSAALKVMPRSARRGKTGKPWIRRLSALSLALFTTLLLVVSGGALSGTSAPPANAFLAGLCGMKSLDAEGMQFNPSRWPGINVAASNVEGGGGAGAGAVGTGFATGINSANPALTQPYPNGYPVTAYEWFGTAGQTFQVQPYDDFEVGCAAVTTALNFAGNLIFGFVQLLVGVGLLLFGWVLNTDIVSPFLSSIKNVAEALNEALFTEYLTPILLLAALWVAWTGLVKKRSSQAVQGVIWTLFAIAAAFVFFNNPTGVARETNNVINYVGESISARIMQVGAGSGGGASDLCYLNTEYTVSKSLQDAGWPNTKEDAGWRIAQCSIWKTFIYNPWAVGTFGTDANKNMNDTFEGVMPLRMPGHDPNSTLAAVWLDLNVFNHNDALTPGKVQADYEGKKEANLNFLKAIANPDGEYRGMWPVFSGNDWTTRMSTAFIALVAAIVGAFPVIVFSLMLLFLQLSFVFMMLIAPLFLTLGIYPGFGRRVALGWVELVLANAIKRIATFLMLGILLAIFNGIMQASDSWLVQVFLISAVGIGMLIYRGRLLGLLTQFDLNGMGTNGLGSEWKRGAGGAAGVVQQGASTYGGGGSFLAGMAVGSIDRKAMGVPGAVTGARKQRKKNLEGEVAASAAQEQAKKEKEERENREQDTNKTLKDIRDTLKDIKDRPGSLNSDGPVISGGGVLPCGVCGSPLVTSEERGAGRHSSCSRSGGGGSGGGGGGTPTPRAEPETSSTGAPTPNSTGGSPSSNPSGAPRRTSTPVAEPRPADPSNTPRETSEPNTQKSSGPAPRTNPGPSRPKKIDDEDGSVPPQF